MVQIVVSIRRACSGTVCIVPSVSWPLSRVPMPRPRPDSYPETNRDQYSVVRHWTWFQKLIMAFVSASGVSTVKRDRYASQSSRRAWNADATSAGCE